MLDETDNSVTIEPGTTETKLLIIPIWNWEKDFSMLKKSYTQTGSFCKVTFKLPAEVNAETAHLVGEFNNWDGSAHPMKKLKDGSFSLTVSLPADKAYRFRYLLDGVHWENDWAADTYVANEHGSDDSLVKI